MKDKKKIDDIYREQLQNAVTPPPADSWEIISSRLPRKKEEKTLPLWMKLSGVAAVFALLFLGFNFHLSDTPSENAVGNEQQNFEENISPASGITPPEDVRITETEPREQKASTPLSQISAAENFATETSAEAVRDRKGNFKQDSSPSEFSPKEVSAIVENKVRKDAPVNKVPAEVRENTEASAPKLTIAGATEPNPDVAPLKQDLKEKLIPTESAISAVESETVQVKNETFLKRFQISTKAGAIYFRMGNGSSIDEQFAGNEGGSEVSMAYGVNLSYQLSERVKIRSGVNKVSLNHNTRQVDYSTVMSSGAVKADPAGMTLLSAPGNLSQEFAFIEVPVEVEFALVDKKIGLSLIGGASTLFLDENSLSMITPSFTTNLGEGQNLSDLSFSVNLGLGAFYRLSPQFRINLEPMIKYQLNTFEHNPGLRSYYFGIFSGFSYQF